MWPIGANGMTDLVSAAWFRFWHRFYLWRPPCPTCYPDGVRVCDWPEPAHWVFKVNAQTGERDEYWAEASGCKHRHHEYEVWYA